MKTFPDFPLFAASSFLSVISTYRKTNCIWELTYRCNAQCPTCSYWKNPTNPQDELQLFEIKKGLDYIYKTGCRCINFSGGEPTLREDLEDIICYAGKKRIWTSLVTNGSLLDQSRIKELKRSHLDNLFISLDFSEREAHDNHRNISGLFDTIIKNLTFLKTNFMSGHRTAGLMCVISEENIDSIYKITELAKKYDVFIAFQLFHPQKTNNGYHSVKNLKTIVSSLLKLKKEYWNVISTTSYIKGMINIYHNNNSCFAGTKYFSIDPLGFLHPCVDLPPIGHILHDPISIINSPKALKLVKECKGCWYCFRGEADHGLSIFGSLEKMVQFIKIIMRNR